MAIPWFRSRNIEVNSSGTPFAGAKAYFFDATTSTPRAVYTDNVLDVPHAHPVVADSNGRWPMVYLPTGLYRVRVTTASDTLLWDDDNIDGTPEQVIEGGGGTPDDEKFTAGDIKARFDDAAIAGWVRCNGRTIGSATSGASERANADCEGLFLHLWVKSAILTVSGGRGASAAADWSANKTIAVPDARGAVLIGLDDMGNSAANVAQISSTVNTTNSSTSATVGSAAGLGLGMYVVSANIPSGATITAISGTTLTLSAAATATASGTAARFSVVTDAQVLGAVGGILSTTLTDNQMPVHNHGGNTGLAGQHSHTYTRYSSKNGDGGVGNFWTGDGTQSTSTAADHQHTIASAGGGQAHGNMQRSLVGGALYIKL